MGIATKLPNTLVWLISGLCLAAVFLFPQLWWLVFLGLALFLRGIVDSESGTVVFLGSCLVGTLKNMGGGYWIWSVDPTYVSILSHPTAEFLSLFLYWILASLSLGTGMAIIGYMLWYSYQRIGIWMLIMFPPFFMIGEFVGSGIFSLVTLGTGASLNIDFNYGFVANTVSHIYILYPVIYLFGSFGLTFVVCFFALCLYMALYKKYYWQRSLVLLLVSILGILVLNNLIQPVVRQNKNENIVTIDTRFSSALLAKPDGYIVQKTETIKALRQALMTDASTILLPEDTRFTTQFRSPNDALVFLQNQNTSVQLVIDSARIRDERGEIVLRAFYYDIPNSHVYTIDKQRLVPQGEYLPYLVEIILVWLAPSDVFEEIINNQNYRPGLDNSYETFPVHIPGLLFCYEAASVFGVKRIITHHKSGIIFHQASHAWFDNPYTLWNQNDAALRIQAIWNQVNILMAGNMVPGALYKANGNIQGGKVIYQTQYWDILEYSL